MKRVISAAMMVICLYLGFCPPALAVSEASERQDAPAGVIEIKDRAGLEAIAENPSGNYALAADIDMGDAPWVPIPFDGRLDGMGHALLNLTVRDFDPVTAVSVDGNAKRYDTVFAALFSRTVGAEINNLTLLGVDVHVSSGRNAFAAGLVGYAENTRISNCTVSGQIRLEAADIMCGVAGFVGFGYGGVTGCEADVTLTLIDTNKEVKCEEFAGGVLATGYADIDGCQVRVRAYTSVSGYVHNGGIAGMYYVHTGDAGHQGYVKNSAVDAEIYFFEDNNDRRAYCEPYVGERLNWALRIEDNTASHFVNGETFDYSKTLLPEKCDAPVYEKTVTEPDCTHFGYTTCVCETCGYSYKTQYTLYRHTPGEWETLRASAGELMGLRRLRCAVCGVLLDEEEFAPPLPASAAPAETPDTATVEVKGSEPPASSRPVIIAAMGALLIALIIAWARFRSGKRGRGDTGR